MGCCGVWGDSGALQKREENIQERFSDVCVLAI